MACDFHLKYASRLTGGFVAAGASPALVTREHGFEFGGDVEEMRVEIRRQVGPDTPVWIVPGRVRELGHLGTVRRLAAARRAFAPDVVHLQERAENDMRIPLVAGARPGRYAYTVHDPVVHPGDVRSRATTLLNGTLLRGAGLVFVHAEPLVEELRAQYRFRAPVVVIPHGIEAPTVTPLPEGPCVLFFGRITHYKGLAVLANAMAAVWAALPATRLIVAGEGDLPEHPALRDPRVEMRIGYIPESSLAGLFAEASVVALPYVQASQSGVGSLAKRHGRPLVVTRTSTGVSFWGLVRPLGAPSSGASPPSGATGPTGATGSTGSSASPKTAVLEYSADGGHSWHTLMHVHAASDGAWSATGNFVKHRLWRVKWVSASGTTYTGAATRAYTTSGKIEY